MEKKFNYQDVFAGEPCNVEVIQDPETGKDYDIPSFVPGKHSTTSTSPGAICMQLHSGIRGRSGRRA